MFGYSDSHSGGQPFRTPAAIQFNYEDLFSYGSERMTASANYRPGNSNTMLRKKAAQPRGTTSSSKPLRSSIKQPKHAAAPSEKSALMDPAEDSFHISPL